MAKVKQAQYQTVHFVKMLNGRNFYCYKYSLILEIHKYKYNLKWEYVLRSYINKCWKVKNSFNKLFYVKTLWKLWTIARQKIVEIPGSILRWCAYDVTWSWWPNFLEFDSLKNSYNRDALKRQQGFSDKKKLKTVVLHTNRHIGISAQSMFLVKDVGADHKCTTVSFAYGSQPQKATWLLDSWRFRN